MRPIGWLDLDALARCSLATCADLRSDAADRILQRAQTADRYRKRFGRRHPLLGDGSIAAAAEGLPAVAVSARLNADYLAALALVISRIQNIRSH